MKHALHLYLHNGAYGNERPAVLPQTKTAEHELEHGLEGVLMIRKDACVDAFRGARTSGVFDGAFAGWWFLFSFLLERHTLFVEPRTWSQVGSAAANMDLLGTRETPAFGHPSQEARGQKSPVYRVPRTDRRSTLDGEKREEDRSPSPEGKAYMGDLVGRGG
ncbi:hypothetical protein CH63R_13525 [Colletotrichum higginsianum IMI 349063]|uniref:Uncharacterized protein n=1 Tax=Colletotrichum higginsianum (strain IMI 349063) TaxID=759273 RepID=A0A1B7XRB3_COLHI|nr:hypothetical protein CH63R_13525 [Colletotrichum higginsianum IMI 349063]OBR02299.1 hypothetical protein CH63R_13525 [Colletotrichum higginsianum IMI 349063]